MLILDSVSKYKFHEYDISISTKKMNNNFTFSTKSSLDKTNVYVSIYRSNYTISTKKSFQKREDDESWFAACVPPIYGSIGLSNIVEYIDHHRKIGIRHFFIYFTNCSNYLQYELQSVLLNTNMSLLCMPWVNYEKNIHQRGQLWHMNDCVHRARSIGWKWVLFNDIDERLHISSTFLNKFSKYDVITFGSKLNNKTTCIDARYKRNINMCLRWGGWRKLVVHTMNILNVYVHFEGNCLNHTNYHPISCKVYNVPADEFWISHKRINNKIIKSLYPEMPGIRQIR